MSLFSLLLLLLLLLLFHTNSESAEKTKDLKLKEVKNGRLAMLACLGFAAQYGATGKGPLDNLADHLAAPLKTTFVDNGVSIPISL